MTEAVVRIDRLGAQGDGVATYDNAPLYVPFALPDEEVKVRIAGERAELLEILHPSADRIEPVCPHFGVCGGCVAQHLSAARYAQWKSDQIRTALSHRGLDIALALPHISPPGSRRRARFTARRDKGSVVLGFAGRRSHVLVDVTDCPVMQPRILAMLPLLRQTFARLMTGKTAAVHITLTDTGLDVDLSGVRSSGAAALMDLAALAEGGDMARLCVDGDVIVERRTPVVHFGGVAVTPPPAAFLQATQDGEDALTNMVKAALADARRVADLFCGIGTFALSLPATVHVAAWDGHGPSIAALTAAVRRANRRVVSRQRDLFRDSLTAIELQGFDAVVLDPPRAGAAAQVAMLAQSDIKSVIMVSCNPATFARDARVLINAGFSCREVKPVDQFLWSPHVELAAAFRR